MVTFTSEKVTDHITRIRAPKTELMYLVEGKEKAALIDTGCGFGSLAAYVKTLTEKPVVVLITHGHLDHAMGSIEFKDVYMNLEDEYIYKENSDKEVRLRWLNSPPVLPDFEQEDFLDPAPLSHYKDMQEGDHFDLGGINIDIYSCPGHTLGSVVMLMREERVLLTGDACNSFCFMFGDYSTSIEQYKRNLEKLLPKVQGKYDRVLSSHATGDLSVSVIEESIEVCDDLLEGKGAGLEFHFNGETAYIAEPVDAESRQRIDGKCANIVYNKNNIFENQ
ncbi:MAG: MBL fold metallo-hydrolase [Oscillospiraceae bacterium]|jgi:hydroxyacylglutathione hydrolase